MSRSVIPNPFEVIGVHQNSSKNPSNRIPVMDRIMNVPKPNDPFLCQVSEFYHPMFVSPDWKGRYFDHLLNLPVEDYGGQTDFMGWLFPLPERIGAESSPEVAAPILDELTYMYMRGSESIGQNLKLALIRMLDIYGFNIRYCKRGAVEDPVITEVSGGTDKFRFWGATYSHHHQRIARIIRSTRILGYETIGAAVMRAFVKAVHDWDLFGNWPYETAVTVLDSWKRAGESPLEVAWDGKIYAPWLSKYQNSTL
ncbi:hypothetical protein F4813DRAFT_376622 [Daldinia decipiens]|uniref:uncharacterized protein n=1 Tax=Daldinia decipiens TaxID=326647 RepID=UPI0020C4A791|nr:uncharacterized protein F4813DRAFT_376622 [Daldinia decipiens]KAI1652824.1 hypothetical protein F4813DRAFT_376622 [Daldinia decipiens]